MVANLNASRDALIAALEGVSEDVARRSPGSGKWSVLECVEHVAVVEAYLLHEIVNARRSEAPMINIVREAVILERGLDRTRRVTAPEAATPRNRFATLSGALEHFQAKRAETIEFVENYTDDPRAMLAQHPLIGTANTYEILLIMAIHPHRHAQQIREILETLKTST